MLTVRDKLLAHGSNATCSEQLIQPLFGISLAIRRDLDKFKRHLLRRRSLFKKFRVGVLPTALLCFIFAFHSSSQIFFALLSVARVRPSLGYSVALARLAV